MPRFAANLHSLFSELPFLDRFEAAAEADFRAVEFQVPYDYAPRSRRFLGRASSGAGDSGVRLCLRQRKTKLDLE